jgi:hypothetical protein
VPDATVLNAAGDPGQLVSEVNAVAEVPARTVSIAQFVTLVQAPVTMTQ